MKKIIFLSVFVFSTILADAQISDVVVDGSWIRVYNENNKQISAMASNSMTIGGITSSFFVVVNGNWIRVYDENCKQISAMSSTGKIVKGASGSTFTVIDGNWIRTYDKDCKLISSRSK